MTSSYFTLGQAIQEFLNDTDSLRRQTYQTELMRFGRWYGQDRSMSSITGHDVASYAESLGTNLVEPAKRLEPIKTFLAHAKKAAWTTTNLATHVKVRRSTESGRRARAMQRQVEPIVLTSEAHQAIEAEIEGLKRQRPHIAQSLRLAMADKDFRENAPLDAARDQQGNLEARIRELQAILKAAVIRDDETPQSTEAVSMGNKVVLRELTSGRETTYELVSRHEANITRGKLSVDSPTGQALLGKGPGQVVEVNAPAGTIRYRIEAING